MIELLSEQLSAKEVYNILIGSIIPRPIALVSTVSNDGINNLAAFSSYNLVSSKPSCVSFAIAYKEDGSKKDTLINLESTGELVINSAQVDQLDAVVTAGMSLPANISEFEYAKVSTKPSDTVKPLRLVDSLIQMECKVYKLIDIGDKSIGSSTLVVAEIIKFHLAEKIYQQGRLQHQNFAALARLGGISYGEIGPTWERKIPQI